eukprot:365326-Chlamydomonas_euryale.AAC.14
MHARTPGNCMRTLSSPPPSPPLGHTCRLLRRIEQHLDGPGMAQRCSPVEAQIDFYLEDGTRRGAHQQSQQLRQDVKLVRVAAARKLGATWIVRNEVSVCLHEQLRHERRAAPQRVAPLAAHVQRGHQRGANRHHPCAGLCQNFLQQLSRQRVKRVGAAADGAAADGGLPVPPTGRPTPLRVRHGVAFRRSRVLATAPQQEQHASPPAPNC